VVERRANLGPHSVLASSSLAILSTRSTIEQNYEEIEDCRQSNDTLTPKHEDKK